jgi:hypothetical protein
MCKNILTCLWPIVLIKILAFRGIAQTISQPIVTSTNGTTPASGYCSSAQIKVAFTAAMFAAGTSFEVQLSSSTGMFPAAPNVIGSGTVSPLTAILPNTTAGGTNYRVRVVSVTMPVVTSTQSLAFTVNTTPTVNPVSNVAYCSSAGVAPIIFSSTTAGTSYTWTSSANVGFGTMGTGNIATFTATNTGPTPVVANVSVTPTVNGCIGTSQSFSITVMPTPTINQVRNVAYCHGALAAAISFSSATAGTTYFWSSSANVGFGIMGIGNIGAFTATNFGSTPVVANVIVTPTTNSCTGISRLFSVTVNPRATTVTLESPVDDYATGTILKSASSVNGKITATNKITGTANVSYQAKSIELANGFRADSGTVFSAELGGCN